MEQQGLTATKTSTNEEPKPWLLVELTEEETETAIVQAKIKKWEYARKMENERRAASQADLARQPWTASQLGGYIAYRAENVLKRPLVIDDDNRQILNLLCYYFTGDPRFETTKISEDQTEYFKLDKGLLLMGGVGVGKTYIMKLFQLTKRVAYEIVDCSVLSNQYGQVGEALIEALGTYKPMVKDYRNFFHSAMGTCFEDLGAEEDKMHFGNKVVLMNEIIHARYSHLYELPFYMTHATTNLSMKELDERYGSRTWSRMTEMFNMIVLTGEDRRK